VIGGWWTALRFRQCPRFGSTLARRDTWYRATSGCCTHTLKSVQQTIAWKHETCNAFELDTMAWHLFRYAENERQKGLLQTIVRTCCIQGSTHTADRRHLFLSESECSKLQALDDLIVLNMFAAPPGGWKGQLCHKETGIRCSGHCQLASRRLGQHLPGSWA
jgi:hypothetical protein